MSKKPKKSGAKGTPEPKGIARGELSDDELEGVAGGTFDDSWIKNSFNNKHIRRDGSVDPGGGVVYEASLPVVKPIKP